MDPNKYFENKRKAYQKAATVAELIDAIADWDNQAANQEYKRNLKKQINRLFRGKLEEARLWATRELNKGEHDYWESQMEDWIPGQPCEC